MDFSTGGLLIGGRPKCLFIWGDHLFLFFFWQRGLINSAGFINPNLTLIPKWLQFRLVNKFDLPRCMTQREPSLEGNSHVLSMDITGNVTII